MDVLLLGSFLNGIELVCVAGWWHRGIGGRSGRKSAIGNLEVEYFVDVRFERFSEVLEGVGEGGSGERGQRVGGREVLGEFRGVVDRCGKCITCESEYGWDAERCKRRTRDLEGVKAEAEVRSIDAFANVPGVLP